MILELVGIPGAGKSTVENLLWPKLSSRGITVLSRKELERKYIGAHFGLARLPLIAVEVFRVCLYLWIATLFLFRSLRAGEFGNLSSISAFRAGYWLSKDLILSRWFCSSRSASNRTEIYCPGEGILQHLASLRVFGGETQSVAKRWLNSSIPQQSYALKINLPVRQGFERFWTRGVPRSWPSGTRDRPIAFEYYLAFEKEIELVIKEHSSGGGKVLVVDTECQLGELESRVDAISEDVAHCH